MASRKSSSASVTPLGKNSKHNVSSSEDKLSQQFSPVTVQESPVKSGGRNLTGNPRKVRDSAAEIHNLIQEWNKNLVSGASVLSSLSGMKLAKIKSNPENESEQYSDDMQQLCDTLDGVFKNMENVVNRLGEIKNELSCLLKLHIMQGASQDPPFLTWPMEKFAEVSGRISDAYKKQLEVAKYVKENIAHCATKENLMFYVAIWVHEPYIESSLKVLLEAMLTETGHR